MILDYLVGELREIDVDILLIFTRDNYIDFQFFTL